MDSSSSTYAPLLESPQAADHPSGRVAPSALRSEVTEIVDHIESVAEILAQIRANQPKSSGNMAELFGKILYPHLVTLGVNASGIQEIIERVILCLDPAQFSTPIDLLKSLFATADAAIAAYIRRLQEMGMAVERAAMIQQRLFPNRMTESGLKVATGFRPCHGITGDLLSIRRAHSGQLLVMVGDVRGKGPEAAIFGSMVLGLYASAAAEDAMRPAGLLTLLNRIVALHSVDNLNVTMQLILWHEEESSFVIANAGCPYPILVDGSVKTLEVGGPPLGMLLDATFDEVTVKVEGEVTMIACTDGIPEQFDADGRQYGDKEFGRFLANSTNVPIEDLVRTLFDDVDSFRADLAQHDDQAAVIMRTLPQSMNKAEIS